MQHVYLVYNYNIIDQQCIHNAIINLGFTLLCTTSDDEMTKKKKGLHLKNLLFSCIYIYKIQIVQNTAQLSSKGTFN
jgi:hypothetical protein